jgi:hypothetical protein
VQVRIFDFAGTRYFSTHKRIDARKSKWTQPLFSDLFKKKVLGELNEEFAERERNLVHIDDYLNIHGENSEDLISLFQFHIRQINEGDRKIFRMDYKDWLQIHESLESYLKKGNKIISPSKYL